MLTVSTFNIQNDYAEYKIDKTYEILKYLKNNNIDILGLQEVNAKISKDLETELNKINYHIFGKYRFKLHYLLKRYNEKTPVITSLEVINHNTYHLPSFPSPQKRIVTKVVIKYQNKLISIYNTHLDYLNEKIKERELKKLYNLIIKDNNLIILMGDFNLKNNKEIFNNFVRLLEEKNIYRVRADEKTLKQSKYNRAIDHIFLSANFKVKSIKVVKDLFISDHYPILINIEI